MASSSVPVDVVEVEDFGDDFDSDATQMYQAEEEVNGEMWEQDLDDSLGETKDDSNDRTDNVTIRSPPQKKSRAGRNVASYGKKMQCVDATAVRTFLQTCRCGCGNNCIHKLHLLGAQGELVCSRIRRARFSGMRLQLPTKYYPTFDCIDNPEIFLPRG
jgi:hypothetical protein